MPQGNQARLLPRQNVDISTYPSTDQISQHQKGSWVTLGDLHGNAAKFLHLLTREGIVEIPPDIYQSLINNYQLSDDYFITEKYFPLDQVTLKKSSPNLRLTGDDFADRGKNDLLIALIYQFLDRQKDFHFEVLASNHGMEFLRQYAYGLNPPDGEPLKMIYRPNALDINGQLHDYSSFGRSYHTLRKYLQEGAIKIEDVNALIQNHYLPHLKLLSCEINSDNQVTLYSHAPITNLGSIQVLAEKVFDISFITDTPQQLKESIDKLNVKFQEIVSDRNKLRQFFEENPLKSEKYKIFDDFLNNRYTDIAKTLEQPQNPPPYKIINVHGHVGEKILGSEEKKSVHISYVNVDTNLGMNDQQSEYYYHVYVSPPPQPQLGLSRSAEDDKIPPSFTPPPPKTASLNTLQIMQNMQVQSKQITTTSRLTENHESKQLDYQIRAPTIKIPENPVEENSSNQEKQIESNMADTPNPTSRKMSR